MNKVADIVDQVDVLPALPATAIRLKNVMQNPCSCVEDIIETIRYDPAVTAQVLKLCNSAFFGVTCRITSLQDAMIRLGTLKVLQLVMSVHTTSHLKQAQKGYGLRSGMLWRHSAAVALASSHLAGRLGLSDSGLVFTAGLLHDIGKVVLNEYLSDEFDKIIQTLSERRCSFLEAEHGVLGYSHAGIGGLIAEKWDLPEAIVRCVRYHHAPNELPEPDPLVDTVYLANCTCLLWGIGLGEDGLCYRADEEVMHRHDLKERDLEALGVQTITDLGRVEQVFGDQASVNKKV